MRTDPSHSKLSLTPLGPGDLIDRAIRFYRKNFWTFVLIAAPPIITGTLFSIGWSVLGREFFGVNSQTPDARIISALFTFLGNFVIWFFESVATLIVMGGASKNFVRHLLFGEPITFWGTYANVRSRFGGLFGASVIIVSILSFVGILIAYLGLTILTLVILLTVAALSFSPFLAFLVSFILGSAIIFGTVWLFFLVASRFAYTPQVMLVEGQRVFSAIGRSTSLASGNVGRLVALFFFTTTATYSALLLFYVPLGWYAYVSGIQIFTFDTDALPAWYLIASQMVSQVSLILLMPVWMIGLCLLYVDERVRHEGYDIELMAARNLGEIPALPSQYSNPLQPALVSQFLPNHPAKPGHSASVLGLD